MKKIALFMAAAILLITVACAGAEETGIFDQLNGQTFTFSSGVGGWSNELTIGKDMNTPGPPGSLSSRTKVRRRKSSRTASDM